MSALLTAAVEYASHRIAVFPVWSIEHGRCGCGNACQSPGKHPISQCAPRGFQDATTDETIIRQWWAQYPSANIATPTSWAIVLDIDPRHGGDATLITLEQQHGALPDTATVFTGGGGRHLYFARPAVLIRNSAGKIGPGVDVRGEGGYVLLPPSAHVSGGTYRDDVDRPLFETPLAPMPAWLVALATAIAPTNGQASHRTSDEWAAKLVGAPEGQRRAVALEIAGHLLGKGIGSREAEEILIMFAARCQPPFPELEVREIVRDLMRRDRAKPSMRASVVPEAPDPIDSSWPSHEPVPTAMLPVPSFDVRGLLPQALAPWVNDVAERAQCPPDYVAVGVMVAVAAVIGRQMTIRPKRHDDWVVVPNLWGLGVGPPGVMKTAALEEGLRGVRALIASAREEHGRALKDYAFHVEQSKSQRDAVKKQMEKAARDGKSTEAWREAFEASAQPDTPVERRYIVNDATIEKLGELLNHNRNGLLLFRDEAAGFLRTMEREAHENDRAFYCEAWNGNGAFSYDRILRGTLHIPACCVSVLGGIQPMPLAAYLHETFKAGQDDGLIQRFQLLVYPDISPTWQNVDRWPDSDGRRRAVEIFRRLDHLDYEMLAADTKGLDLPFLHLTPEAQTVFDNWRAGLEHRLRTADEHPAFISHLAKYRSLVPSLALLLHLVDCVDHGRGGPVSASATERAVAWTRYLEPHAKRVYEPVISPGRQAAANLAKKIAGGQLASPFSIRDIRRKCWAGLTEGEDILAGLDQLEGLHWIRREAVRHPAGGRTTAQYRVNPTVQQARS
jgi:putative DNA primase/helicase